MKKFTPLLLLFFCAFCNNSSPIKIDPRNNNSTAYGIDISRHQDKVINDLNAHDALTFVICKASEGADYTDPDFSFNWEHIKKRGLVRGAYHFYRDNDDPFIQAKFFLKKIKDLEETDLPPIVDIEDGSLTENTDKKNLQKNLLQHLQYIESQSGRKPMIYTNLHFADHYLTDKNFAQYPLWLAEYSNGKKPKLPKAWEKVGHKFWQKSEGYKVESKVSDFDIFNGTRQELLRGLRQAK